MTQCKLYTRAAAAAAAVNKVADGADGPMRADVVFTDTEMILSSYNCIIYQN